MTKDEALKQLANEMLVTLPFNTPEYWMGRIKEALAQTQDGTYTYASSLATTIWQKHYIKDSPKWKPLDTIDGVLTQIDNMTCGLVREKPAQPEQEPVAWLLTDKNINSLQVDSIQRLIDRLKHAHHTDLCVRINGQDEWFQADWLKHLTRTTPPQRKPLTDEEIDAVTDSQWAKGVNKPIYAAHRAYARAIEAKLKEKNT